MRYFAEEGCERLYRSTMKKEANVQHYGFELHFSSIFLILYSLVLNLFHRTSNSSWNSILQSYSRLGRYLVSSWSIRSILYYSATNNNQPPNLIPNLHTTALESSKTPKKTSTVIQLLRHYPAPRRIPQTQAHKPTSNSFQPHIGKPPSRPSKSLRRRKLIN